RRSRLSVAQAASRRSGNAASARIPLDTPNDVGRVLPAGNSRRNSVADLVTGFARSPIPNRTVPGPTKATAVTGAGCGLEVVRIFRAGTPQTWADPSVPPEARYRPSGEKARVW